MQLQLQDLCKQYGTKCAVNHVNANLAPGVYGLLGANGAGKTKLVTAKIISSMLFGFLAFTLHIIVAFGLPLAVFGTDGWNLPLQIDSLSVYIPASDPHQSWRYLFGTDCYDWSDIAFIC